MSYLRKRFHYSVFYFFSGGPIAQAEERARPPQRHSDHGHESHQDRHHRVQRAHQKEGQWTRKYAATSKSCYLNINTDLVFSPHKIRT